MTTTLKYEEFETNSGVTVYIEKYQDKGKPAFWRYGSKTMMRNGVCITTKWGDMLLNKPNRKRIIERY